MYDLCALSEQPQPAPAHPEMENREEAEAVGHQQQELRGSMDQDENHRGVLKKDVTNVAHFTKTSLLGKRHHSLYANLSGCEVEGLRKVNMQHFCAVLVFFNYIKSL